MEVYKLPIGAAGEWAVGYSTTTLKPAFEMLGILILATSQALRTVLLGVPPWLLIAVAMTLAWRFSGRALAVFALVSLSLVWNLRLWEAAAVSLSLVVTAGLLSLLVAIPLGILMAERRAVAALLTPIMDFLQTMPRFIYLIPGIIIFAIDTVGGVVATMTLAVPPPVRLTALGIREINREVIEAGEAFGCTWWQLLRKVKLPLAFPSILLGINQCIMMSLSLVVIASLIGARGLGTAVIQAITRVDISEGVEAGLAVVVLAMVLDRVTRGTVRSRGETGWL